MIASNNNIQMQVVPTPTHDDSEMTSYCTSTSTSTSTSIRDVNAAAAAVQQHQQVQMRIALANLNNHGSALIDSGDIDGGIIYLKQALQASKQLIKSEAGRNTSSSRGHTATKTLSLDQLISIKTNNDDDDDEDCDDDFTTYYNNELNNKTSETSGGRSSSTSSTTYNYSHHPQGGGEQERHLQQGPFLFRRPLRIVPSSENVLLESESTQLITTTIVFNLGIAIHQRSYDCHDDQPLLLKKAIQLYECALNTIVNKSTTNNNSNNTVIVGKEMMLLVILNNLTYAHSKLGNTIEVTNIANYSLSALMLVIDQSRACDNNDNNNNSDTKNFLDCLFQSIHHYIYVANPTIASSA